MVVVTGCFFVVVKMLIVFVCTYLGGADGIVHLKVLIPSVAAGAIIGKGGETIADVQKQTGGKIKMSKSNDFYPGEDLFLLCIVVD